MERLRGAAPRLGRVPWLLAACKYEVRSRVCVPQTIRSGSRTDPSTVEVPFSGKSGRRAIATGWSRGEQATKEREGGMVNVTDRVRHFHTNPSRVLYLSFVSWVVNMFLAKRKKYKCFSEYICNVFARAGSEAYDSAKLQVSNICL